MIYTNEKHLFLLMLSTAILAGCSKNEGGEGEPFTPPAQEQLTQNAYADNESTGGGFFTASAPWTATVNEVQAQASALASVQTKSVTRAADNNGNNVVWLKLYNGDKEAYSGGAGTITPASRSTRTIRENGARRRLPSVRATTPLP